MYGTYIHYVPAGLCVIMFLLSSVNCLNTSCTNVLTSLGYPLSLRHTAQNLHAVLLSGSTAVSV